MRKQTQEDKEYRQGRSLRQVEDSEIMIGWAFTMGGVGLLVGILVSLISGS